MFRAPDTVEYYFEMNVNVMVLCLHRVVRRLENDRGTKVLNITIEDAGYSLETYERLYTMIVVKSSNRQTKSSLLELLKQTLAPNTRRWSQ